MQLTLLVLRILVALLWHPSLLRPSLCDADEPCFAHTAQEPESSFTMSPRNTTRPWNFGSNFGFLRWQMSISVAHWTVLCSFCGFWMTSLLLQLRILELTDVHQRCTLNCPLLLLWLLDDLSFAPDFGHLPCWQFFELSHFLSTAASASEIVIAGGIGLSCAEDRNDSTNWTLLPAMRASTMHACFDLRLSDHPQVSLYWRVFTLKGMADCLGNSNFSVRFSWFLSTQYLLDQ